ncbi:unnamed protein product [Phyllotreta striolata]|uniref:GPI transamidase component PIG-S n=1 Tax=Phyllotreta striolata TaxID=444603 RepID=A0A9N9XVZ1_PHYSR|nr:unnamed protein product [Phyllotreta striolata]
MSQSKQENREEIDQINTRIIISISYIVVFLVIGVPLWWCTTRVYRASLPLSDMQNLESNHYQTKSLGMPLSLEYDVLLSLVHSDPLGSDVAKTVEEIEENLYAILRNFSDVFDVVFKSQCVHVPDLKIPLAQMSEQYALSENQLPHIITPLESQLRTHLSNRTTINVVIYFQNCDKPPIYLYYDNNTRVPSNAFSSPSWGGIHILNPDSKSCRYPAFELNHIISAIVTEIQHLFDIKDIQNLHEFKHRKAQEMLASTRRTLKSLAKLLSEIANIVISEDVGRKIRRSLKALEDGETFSKEGRVDEALKAAKVAYENSESAFGDPSLLAMQYFPEEDKKSVYMPLFLPLVFVLTASLSNLKVLLKERSRLLQH